MYRCLFLASFLIVLLTGCQVEGGGVSSSEENRDPAASAISRTFEDLLEGGRLPSSYHLISDGSGFTPVSGVRTYDYANWYILKSDSDWSQSSSIVWSWNPREESTFTSAQRDAFIGARDGKFVNERTQALFVGSNGGVALVQLSPKEVVFYGNVGTNTNPHSAELLPDGNIVVVSSSDQKLTVLSVHASYSQSYALPGAHGVVWDARREVLWTLGTTLKAFTYNEDEDAPAFSLLQTYALPSDTGGHDLMLSESGKLLVTSINWTGTFDPDLETFDTIPHLTRTNVKSLTQILDGFIYTFPVADSRIKTPSQSWWTETLTFITEAGSLTTKTIPGARIYKVR